jgi:hypothetical protein
MADVTNIKTAKESRVALSYVKGTISKYEKRNF